MAALLSVEHVVGGSCRVCARFGGLGFSYEFLQLAFDVEASAEHLGGEDAVGVDGEVAGDAFDLEELAEPAADVAILRPGHTVFLDEVFPCLRVLIPADAEDDERLAGEVLGYLFDLRKLFITRATPGGPEVDKNDASIHLIEVEVGTIERSDGEGRSQLLKNKGRVFREALGAEVERIVGLDGNQAGFETGTGGFGLAEVDEHLAVSEEGSEVFGVEGEGYFKSSVCGVEQGGIVF